jgi:RNase P/RNase MRP subunit p29
MDLIGVELYAKSKTNPTWATFKEIGTVIDETKNTLIMQHSDDIKTYIKSQYIFHVKIPPTDGSNNMLEFDGNKIIGNPENRIKKMKKKIRRRNN